MRYPSLTRALPLLAKELVERAGRKRTYVVRVLYALAMFTFFAVAFQEVFWSLVQGGSPRTVLGQGGLLLVPLMVVQFVGIYVFLPALMSGVISREKENGTLALLMITDLSPRDILLQKYVSGLVPMLTILLLSMPLFGLAYTLGGFSTGTLWGGIYLLFLTCLQVGAISLAASSFAGNPAGAFIGTYLVGAVVCLAPVLIVIVGSLYHVDLIRALDEERVAFAFMPPLVFVETMARSTSLRTMFSYSVPTILCTGVFLAAARFLLHRRAFVPPRNLLLRIWRPIDNFMVWLNDEYGHGIVLVRDDQSYPEEAPVAWREVKRRALGKARYLFRILVVLELPIVLMLAFTLVDRRMIGTYRGSESPLVVYVVGLWIIAGLAILGWTVNAFPTERARNTLDLLLSTPMAGSEIVKQKMRGCLRLKWVLWIPLFTVIGVEALAEATPMREMDPVAGRLLYTVFSAALAVTYLSLLSWLGLWIGLRSRRRFKAMIVALGLVIAWNALPILVIASLLESGGTSLFRANLGMLARQLMVALWHTLSPALNIVVLDLGQMFGLGRGYFFGVVSHQNLFVILLTMSLAIHAGLWWWLRRHCLKRADDLLGRSREPGPDEHPEEPAEELEKLLARLNITDSRKGNAQAGVSP